MYMYLYVHAGLYEHSCGLLHAQQNNGVLVAMITVLQERFLWTYKNTQILLHVHCTCTVSTLYKYTCMDVGCMPCNYNCQKSSAGYHLNLDNTQGFEGSCFKELINLVFTIVQVPIQRSLCDISFEGFILVQYISCIFTLNCYTF